MKLRKIATASALFAGLLALASQQAQPAEVAADTTAPPKPETEVVYVTEYEPSYVYVTETVTETETETITEAVTEYVYINAAEAELDGAFSDGYRQGESDGYGDGYWQGYRDCMADYELEPMN